jgi:copper transport protein
MAHVVAFLTMACRKGPRFRVSVSNLICRSRRLCALGVVLVATAVAPNAAQAHAALQDASPEPGARLGSSPAQVTIAFTEPLNHALTTARVVNARSGRRIAVAVSFGAGNRMVLRPSRPLPTGAYRVQWHTVSVRDGHTLEGSFGFGVRTSAVGGAAQLEQSPLARDGWLRVVLRAAWYMALFFFGGGLLCGVMLSSRVDPAGWLLAGEGAGVLAPGGRPDASLARIWRRTRAAGWIAAAAGVGVALAETQDAAGSISWHSIDAYLLSNVSGAARALSVIAVLLAVLLVNRARRAAAIALVASLAAVAVGGHANSVSPRVLALLSDWSHLTAAVVWAGVSPRSWRRGCLVSGPCRSWSASAGCARCSTASGAWRCRRSRSS